MLEETATVVSRDGDFAWVEAGRQSACGNCSSSGTCGTGVLAKVLGRQRVRMRVLNAIGARTGDRVVVGINERALLRGAIKVYLFPLIGLFGGGMLGRVIAEHWRLSGVEAAVAICALLGFGATWFFLKGLAYGMGSSTGEQPVVLRRAAG